MKTLKTVFPFIIIVVLSSWAVAPLFSSGFFPFHDDTQVVRVFEMKKALTDGMFPVRWSEDLGYGYGYPIFNFYAPFAYYVGGFFNLFVDSLLATKIMMGLGMILAGIFMYLFAREFWGKIGGVISAILYVYAPYHALNLYVRGAIAEFWAYACIPLAFLGIYKIFKSKVFPLLWVSITAFSYAAIILSHNLTAMMVTPFLFLFALILFVISHKEKKHFNKYDLFISLLLGIVLSAFYWLPVAFEMHYTNVFSVVGGGSDYKDHFVCLSQLWNSPWAFGGSVPGCVDGMSFRIGKLHILLAIIALGVLFLRKSDKKIFFAISFSLVGAAVSISLTLPFSKFLWDAIPQMAFFQFPWRFLVLVSLFVSFLGGAIFILLPRTLQKIGGIIVICIIVFFYARLFLPSKILPVTAEYYTNRSSITWTTSKISDEYMPQGFYKPQKSSEVPKNKIFLADSTAKVLSLQEKTQQVTIAVTTPHKTDAILHIAYFPAWKMFLDGKAVNFRRLRNGLQVTIPPGKHTLEAVFIQTPIEKLANIVSLTGVMVLLLGIIYARKRVYEWKKTKS